MNILLKIVVEKRFDLATKFILICEVDGIERKRVVFLRKDLKQVAEGLRYAAARDSVSDRRKHYGVLNDLFWKVLR